MRLSRAKVNHLSRLVVDALGDHPETRFIRDTNNVRLAVVSIIEEELRRDEYIDRKARQKIASQARDIPEGGPDWEILYRQFYRDEFDRHRPVR
ncbi:MAG: DUF507 family protein [Acidobacteria bacterium]|nr:DUF507 family protein [Acidobacteriota bacterium]